LPISEWAQINDAHGLELNRNFQLLLDKINKSAIIFYFCRTDSQQEDIFMYAVIASGGKQYRVESGGILRVEKLPGEIGSPITFDRVLMVSDGDNVRVGTPVVDDAIVQGHIVEQGKSKKIIVFKYKRRKRYRRKQGHRQPYTAIKIDTIEA
jgi:large subunit ribosomal protein L21